LLAEFPAIWLHFVHGGAFALELAGQSGQNVRPRAPEPVSRCAAPRCRHRFYMTQSPKDPLHGVTLEAILNDLVAKLGWDGLAERIDIRCFKSDPSIKSSLTFLRKTPWAREKVEALYVRLQRKG
jgi:hypothetical protein